MLAPNEHGKRLIPVTIDEIARDEPQRIWAFVQLPGDEHFTGISYWSFANAINRELCETFSVLDSIS